MIKKILGSIALSSMLLAGTAIAGERGFGDDATTTKATSLSFPLLFKVSHKKWVNNVKFSPDSKTFVTASDDKTAKLWDLEGELIFSMNENNDEVHQVIFNKDGSQIITRSSGDKEKAVIIYNSSTGAKLNTITEKSGSNYYTIDSMGFIPNSNSLIVGTDAYDSGYKIHIYDLINQKLISTIKSEISPEQFSVTPDGKKIAVQYYSKIKIYYIKNGELYTEFEVDGSDDYYTDNNIQFIDNSKLLTVNSSAGNLDIWNIKTSTKESTIRGTKATDSYGDIYQVGKLTGTTGIFINYQAGGYSTYATDLFTTDGEYIGTLKDTRTDTIVSDFDVSKDKTKLAVAYKNGEVQIFDIRTLTNGQTSTSSKPIIKDLEDILKDSNTLNVKFQAIQN